MTEAEAGTWAEGALAAAQPAAPLEEQKDRLEGDCLDPAEISPAGSLQASEGAAAASGAAPGGSEAPSGSESEGEDGRQPTAAAEAAAAAAGSAGAKPENAAAGGGNSNSGGADGGAQKRDYVKWRPEEEEAFYAALRGVAGQKPEKVIREVMQRVGTKDYAQVRHYYYRLIKRLNKILGEDSKLDTKNSLQVHRAMVKFWDVFVQKGMRGTCMVGITKKPRKQKELSTTVQRGVKAVLQRTSKAAAAAAAGGGRGGTAGASRKRKPRAADAAAPTAAEAAAEAAGAGGGARGQDTAGGAGDVVMADAEAHPPTKQRRTAGPATRKQQQLAAAEVQAEAGAAAGTKAAGAPDEGSSQSQMGAHEAGCASGQPASSSHTAGSQRQAEVQPARPGGGTAHSFRSSSNAGLSGAMLEGSMGQVGGKLRLQLMPLDGATAQAMAAAGHHPFLELMLSSSKSLASVLRHLGSKWHLAAAAAANTGGSASLFVHPPADCPITLRGMCWGGQDCDSQLKVGDIYTTLHCPAPFQLLYAWGRPAGSSPAAAASAGAAAASQEAGGAAAAAAVVAAAAAAPSGKQASSRAALQRQRSEPAEADQLAAELRQALSAVTATAPAEPASEACLQQQQQQQQQQQLAQQQQEYCLQVQQPQLGSFVQLLTAGDGNALLAGAALQTGFSPGVGPAAPAATHVPAGTPVAMQPMAVLPPPRCDEQPPAAAAPQLPAVPPKTVQRQQGKAAAAAASTGSTPEAGAVPGQTPAGEAGGEAAPVTDPRKPRGLLGLLQTTPPPAAKAGKVRKQQSTQRKRPQSSQRKKQPQQQQQQQQQAGAAGVPQEYGGAPLPMGPYGPFMWAHMHPHLQQPQPVAVLHHQQPPAVLQAEPQMPILQPPQPVQQPQLPAQPQPLGFGAGGDTLFQLLDGDAQLGTGFADMPVFGSPAKELPPGEAVPLLPGCDDFSLKSWPNLSPPSNFQLPDGFDTGLWPTGKAAGAAPPARLTGGGAKAGAAAAAAAAAGVQGGRAGGARALDSALGPTDFSLLLASVSGGDATKQQQHQQAAASAHLQPAGGRAGQQAQVEQPSLGHAAAHQALEAIFGGTSLFGTLLGAPTGTTRQAQQAADGGTGGVAPLQLVPDKALADLTCDFGSLLGVGDSPPSWPAGGGDGQGQPQCQPGQQAPPSGTALGERHFAALFGS